MQKTVHVLPNNAEGGWSVKRGNAQQASICLDTKEDAIRMGRIISQRTESELVIHGKDGAIQRSDNHKDEYSPYQSKK